MRRSLQLTPTLLKLTLLLLVFSGGLNTKAQLNAAFTVDSTEGCAPHTVSFQNNSTGAVTYLWNFGNGTTSNQENPTMTFSQPGVYFCMLVAFDQNGNSDTLHQADLITVSSGPTANYSVNQVGACSNNNTIQFTNLSQNADSVLWYFGDGTISSDSHPVHNYSLDGSFTPTLTVIDSIGCTDNYSLSNPIIIDPTAQADIIVDTNFWCGTNHPFQFQASSSTSQIVAATWEFGDSSGFVTGNNLQHQYATHGQFTPKAVVTNNYGCTDTSYLTGSISIHPEPSPVIQISDDSLCIPQNVAFNVTGLTSVSWLIDGSVFDTVTTTDYDFVQSGNHTIDLHGIDQNGCEFGPVTVQNITANQLQPAQINISPGSGCAPLDVTYSTQNVLQSYEWRTNGNSFSTVPSGIRQFSNPGSAGIKLIYTDQFGCEGDTVTSINVYGPEVEIDVNSNSICLPFDAIFQSQMNNVASFQWEFGDGTTSPQHNPTHSYPGPGTYNPFLIATDAAGCTDTASLNSPITIFDATDGLSYTHDTLYGCAPYTHQFYHNGIGSSSWNWTFGDGSGASQPFPVHSYNTNGTYVVGLSTQTNTGCTISIDTMFIVVIDEPEANIDLSVSGSCPLPEVLFTSNSPADSIQWTFHDDSIAFGDSVSIPFSGGFGHVLTEISQGGCTSEAFTMFGLTCPAQGGPSVAIGPQVIQDPLIIDYSEIHNAVICSPYMIHLQTPFVGCSSWYWDFGDGTNSTVAEPIHTYQAQGNYSIYHRGITPQGDTLELYIINVDVKPSPTSHTDISIQPGCQNHSVTANYPGQNVANISWVFDNTNLMNGDSVLYQFPVSQGVLLVHLEAENSYGCSIEKDTIVGIPQFEVNVNYSNEACYGDTVFFTLSSNPVFDLYWNFGDSSATVHDNGSTYHVYDEGGYFQPILYVDKGNGCIDTISLPHPVEIIEPDAGFWTSKTDYCVGERVTFHANDQSAQSYQWMVKPNGYRYGANPYWFYNQPGTYDVWLDITQEGCSKRDTVHNAIHIHEVIADFESIQNQTCSPFNVDFTNQTTGSAIWSWHFGDGDSSTVENPIHTYTQFPTDSVTFVAVDSFGCSDTTRKWVAELLSVAFTVTDTAGCAPFEADFNNTSTGTIWWNWNFGDGTTSTVENPSHIYTSEGNYTVTLIAGSSSSCADTIQFVNLIHVEKAYAQGTLNSVGICSPVITNFTASLPVSQSYLWSFGDGGTSNLQSPTNIYTNNGVYEPQLITETPLGCLDTLILPTVFVQSPEIDSTLPSVDGCAPLTVQFPNPSTSGTAYNWTFGNGQASTSPSPNMTFGIPGVYGIGITVTDSLGCSSSIYLDSIVEVHGNPESALHISDTGVCEGTGITAIDSGFVNGNIQWHMGDGAMYNTSAIGHTYQQPGSYFIEVVRSTIYGCMDTASTSIDIYPNPNAAFELEDIAGCPPFETDVNIPGNQTPLNIDGWMVDQDTFHLVSNTILVEEAGMHTVTHFVETIYGCSDLAAHEITVINDEPLPSPKINRSTVVNDNIVVTEWKTPDSLDNVSEQWLFRGTSPDSLQLIDVLPDYQNEYADTDVDVHKGNYYYKVALINTCSVKSKESNFGSSVYLEADRINEVEVKLSWTKYEEWKNGVGRYLIQKQDAYGNWITIKETDGSTTKATLND